MRTAQRIDPPAALGGEGQPHDPAIAPITPARYETEQLSPVDELDRRVVPDGKMLSNLANRRTPRVIVPANCQQQLMLCVGQPEVASTLLTPPVEASQLSSESQQPPIVRVGKNHAQQVLCHR